MRSNYAYRIIKAKWVDSSDTGYQTDIVLTGIDNLGLVNTVTAEISNHLNVDIKGLSFTTQGGIFKGKITVVVRNNALLKTLIENLKKIDGIDQVTRV